MVIPQKLTGRLYGAAELRFICRHASSSSSLRETVLYKFHVQQGAKMVPFAGFNMPLEYKTGIIGAHLHTRKHVSIFDVSHMLQTFVHGKDRFEFLGKARIFFLIFS